MNALENLLTLVEREITSICSLAAKPRRVRTEDDEGRLIGYLRPDSATWERYQCIVKRMMYRDAFRRLYREAVGEFPELSIDLHSLRKERARLLRRAANFLATSELTAVDTVELPALIVGDMLSLLRRDINDVMRNRGESVSKGQNNTYFEAGANAQNDARRAIEAKGGVD